MWANDLAMARAVAAEMVKLLRPQPRNDTPEFSEPEAFKPEKPKKGETYIEMLQRRTRDDVRAGRAVSMNALGRSIEPKRPPRRPGEQQLQSTAFWNWWR